MAVSRQDIPFLTVGSGDWNTASVWNKNAGAGAADKAIINRGYSIQVSNAAASKFTRIRTGASLGISSSFNAEQVENLGTVAMTGGSYGGRSLLNGHRARLLLQGGAMTLTSDLSGGSLDTVHVTG